MKSNWRSEPIKYNDEKALDCADAIEELREQEAELYKQRFDNIATQYDGILQVIDFQKSMIDEFISQSEANGYITSTKYYGALIKQEQANINQLNNEKNALLSSLADAVNSGQITEGSEAWYEMCNQIDEVTLAIEEGNTALIEYNNSIRDIKWQVFDLLQDRISQITSEADFLIDLLSNDKLYDDKGQLTSEGLSTMGLHGVNYNTYMYQADEYAKEILRIDKELANDPYNQDLVDRRQELLELQQESILAAEDEKEAIRDMVEEGIKLELDSLKELIDAYTDALDSQKDLYDYQKKIAKQTKEIASLEKQLSAYANDTSEETRAKIQKIKVSLEEAKENLEETEYERYISDTKKLLDDLYSEYETILNQRLDNIDLLISDMIATINDNSNIISRTLSDKAESVGYTLSDNMYSIWDSNSTKIVNVLTTYGQNIASVVTTVNSTLSTINSNLTKMITDLDKIAGTKTTAATTPNSSTASATTSSPVKNNNNNSSVAPASSSADKSSNNNSWGSFFVSKTDSYPKNKLNINSSIVDRLKYFNFDSSMSARKTYFTKMGGNGIYIGSDSQNSWMINQMKAHGYKNGVFNLFKDEWAWTQENKPEAIIRPSDGAILTPLLKGDSVLNADATKNMYDMFNDPQKYILDTVKPNLNGIVKSQNVGGNTYSGDFKFSINLPNVMNYEQFKYAFQHDSQFERFVRSITVDRMFGGSSLRKYNC